MTDGNELRVDGMSCQGCERAVEAAAKGVPGIAAAHADHNTGTLRVELAPGATLDREQLEATIRDAGYQPVTD